METDGGWGEERASEGGGRREREREFDSSDCHGCCIIDVPRIPRCRRTSQPVGPCVCICVTCVRARACTCKSQWFVVAPGGALTVNISISQAAQPPDDAACLSC